MQVDFFVCSLQSETVKRVDNDSDMFYLMTAELTSSVWSPEFRLSFQIKPDQKTNMCHLNQNRTFFFHKKVC